MTEQQAAAPTTEPQTGDTQQQGVEIPKKFLGPDGQPDISKLVKSYLELEKKLSAGSKPEPDTANKGEPSEPEPEKEPEVPPGLTKEQVQKFEAEINETGKLSEESYRELAKAGYPRHVVDAYIRAQLQAVQNAPDSGQKDAAVDEQQAQEIVNEALSVVGGEAQYRAMVEWASQNLSPEEQEAFDKVILSGGREAIKLAVAGLYHRFMSATSGSEPARRVGASSPAADIFTSREQVKQAMRDPRYRTDPAYRREVIERLRRSIGHI